MRHIEDEEYTIELGDRAEADEYAADCGMYVADEIYLGVAKNRTMHGPDGSSFFSRGGHLERVRCQKDAVKTLYLLRTIRKQRIVL